MISQRCSNQGLTQTSAANPQVDALIEEELKRKIKKSRGAEKRKVLATRKVETKADIKRAKEEYLKKLIA